MGILAQVAMDKINREGAKQHFAKGKDLLAPGAKQSIEGAIAEISKAIFRE